VLSYQNAPPGSPALGDRYLIGNSPTGAWSGLSKRIAVWNGSAWQFIQAIEGMILYNLGDGYYYRYNGSAWTTQVRAGSVEINYTLEHTGSQVGFFGAKPVAGEICSGEHS